MVNRTAIVIAILLTAVAGLADNADFRVADVFESAQVEDLHRIDGGGDVFSGARLRLSSAGDYVEYAFLPDMQDGADRGGTVGSLDDFACARYSPFRAQSATLTLDGRGTLRVTCRRYGERPADALELYRGPADGLDLVVPHQLLVWKEEDPRVHLIFRLEATTGSVELDELRLSWETSGFAQNYNWYVLRKGDPEERDEARGWCALLENEKPGLIQQTINWGWAQPTFLYWLWEWDENGGPAEADVPEDKLNATRLLRFYSGEPLRVRGGELSGTGVGQCEFVFELSAEDYPRFTTYGRCDDLTANSDKLFDYDWDPRGGDANQHFFYAFEHNAWIYDPTYPFFKNDRTSFTKEYVDTPRVSYYLEGRGDDGRVRLYRTKDEDDFYVLRCYLHLYFSDKVLDENHGFRDHGPAHVQPPARIDFRGRLPIDYYNYWEGKLPKDGEPVPGIRTFLLKTVEELEETTPVERANPDYRIGLPRNISGYGLINEPQYDVRRLRERGQEYYALAGYNYDLQRHFAHWLLEEDPLEGDWIWGDHGYRGTPAERVAQIERAWGVDLDYRPGDSFDEAGIELPVRRVEPRADGVNEWESRHFDRHWYDYIRFLHHSQEIFLHFNTNVLEQALKVRDTDGDGQGDDLTDLRRIYGPESTFWEKGVSFNSSHQNPAALGTDVGGANTYGSDWAGFIGPVRAAQGLWTDDPADPFGERRIFMGEYGVGFSAERDWDSIPSIADSSWMLQYFNWLDVPVHFQVFMLRGMARERHYRFNFDTGEWGWTPGDPAEEVFHRYVDPTPDLHFDRTRRVLLVYDPPSLSCGSFGDIRYALIRAAIGLHHTGAYPDIWPAWRLNRLFNPTDAELLAERYKLLVLPDMFIIDEETEELLDAYIAAGGKIVFFEGVGTRRIDGAGRLSPHLCRSLYGSERPDDKEFASDSRSTVNLAAKHDFGYLGDGDGTPLNVTRSDGVNDAENHMFYAPVDGGRVIAEAAGEPLINLLDADGDDYGSRLYVGAGYAPYFHFADDWLGVKLLASAARWAGIDPYEGAAPAVSLQDPGFEEASRSFWKTTHGGNSDNLAQLTANGAVYGERCIHLRYEAGDPAGYAAVATTERNQPLGGFEPGRQYTLFLDARALRREVDDYFREVDGQPGQAGPYLKLSLNVCPKGSDEPLPASAGSVEWAWVFNLFNDDEWHRYDAPFVCPHYDPASQWLSLELSLDDGLQLEREEYSGAWSTDRRIDYAGSGLLLDNVGVWRDDCVADTLFDPRANHGHDHVLDLDDGDALLAFKPGTFDLPAATRVLLLLDFDGAPPAGLTVGLDRRFTADNEDTVRGGWTGNGTGRELISHGGRPAVDVTDLYEDWSASGDETFALRLGGDGELLSRENWDFAERPRLVPVW